MTVWTRWCGSVGVLVVLWPALAISVACSSNSGDSSAETSGTDGGRSSAVDSAATGGRSTGQGEGQGGTASTTAGAPTWNQLWANYFEPQCSSCHADTSIVGSRKTFASASQLCTFLTGQRQLNGSTSPALISGTQSVLVWFNPNGSMPEGNPGAPQNATRDLRAWAAAGAVCP